MKVTLEKQTQDGLERRTERTWIYAENHKVLVETMQNICSRGSWAGNGNHFAKVTYTCECGKFYATNGNPKKSTLVKHDTWYTKEEIAQILESLKL